MQQEQKKTEQIESGAIKEEDWVPEVREWPAIPIAPIETTRRAFVVCLDSMGQDREFTADQKRFALKAVLRFRKYWEEFEEAQLIADRNALLKLREEDEEIFTEEYQQQKEEKGAQLAENYLNPPKPEDGS